MLFANIAVALLLVCESFAQVDPSNSCLNYIGVDFDFYQGSGLWYEYASTYDHYKSQLRCIIHDWRLPHGDDVAKVMALGISKKTGLQFGIETTYTKSKPNNTLHSSAIVPLHGKATYSYRDLVDVYDDYAVSGSCMMQGSKSVPVFTIFTREPYPKTNVVRRAIKLISKLGYSNRNFVIYDTNCY